MGKKNYTDALSSMGISTAAVDHLTKQHLRGLTDDPINDVPRLSRLEATGTPSVDGGGRSERTPVFYTSPRDVWERREGARKAANELGNELRAAGYAGIKTEVTTRVNGGYRELVVNVVKVDRVRSDPDRGSRAKKRMTAEPAISLAELYGVVPESLECTVGEKKYETTVEDIPVAVEERTEELTDSACFEDGDFDSYYDPIPGGVQFMWAHLGHCTLCCPVYDNDAGEERLLTAAHCVFDRHKHDVEDLTHTERIYQPYPHHFLNADWNTDVGHPDPDKMIGDYSGDYDEINDAAIVGLSKTDRSLDWSMGRDDGGYSDEPIKGTIAFDKLVDEAGNSYTVYQQGRSTGVDQGSLGSVSDADNDLGSVHLNGIQTAGGDSGGPFYRIEEDCDGNDAIFLVGVQHTKTSYRNKPIGNAVALVEEALNVEVNPNATC